MKYLISLASKYIKRQKFRTILTFISIVLASFIMCIGLITLSSVLASLKQTVIKTEGKWEADLSECIDNENISDVLKKLDGHIMVDDLFYQNESSIDIPYTDKGAYYEVSYDNKGKLLCKSVIQDTVYGNKDIGRINVLNNCPLAANKDSGIILSDLFKDYGYSEGDSITLVFKYVSDKYSQEVYTDCFIIEGFSNSPASGTRSMRFSVSPGKNVVREIMKNTITSEKNQEDSISDYFYGNLYIRTNSGYDFDKCINQILKDIGSDKTYTDLLSNEENINANLLLFELKALIHPDNVISIAGVLAAFLFLFWLVERFIIDNAFEISVIERNRKFTVLKTLGASKDQLKSLTRFEALFYCLTAVPAGIIISYIIMRFLFSLFSKAGISSMVFSAHPAILASAFVLCAISVIISSYTSALWNTRKFTLIRSINYGNNVKIKKNKRMSGKYLNKNQNQFMKTYSKRNMKRGKGKYIFSAFASSVSIILLISMLSTATAIKKEVDRILTFVDPLDLADFNISTSSERPENIFNFFQRGKDIIQCRVSGSAKNFDLFDLDTDSKPQEQIYKKFAPDIDSKPCFLETIDRYEYDKNIKDVMKISYDELVRSGKSFIVFNSDERKERFKPVSEYGLESEPEIQFGKIKTNIMGLIYFERNTTHSPGSVLIPIENVMDKSLGSCRIRITVKDSKNYKKAAALCEEFVQTNPHIDYYEDEFMTNTGLKNIISAVAITAIVFFVFTWLTGIISIINLTNTRIMNSQKEYFILRCLGMSKRQLIYSILYDVVRFSVLSTVIGIVIGCLGTSAAINAMSDADRIILDNITVCIPVCIAALVINILIPTLCAMPLIKKMSDTSSEIVNSNDTR